MKNDDDENESKKEWKILKQTHLNDKVKFFFSSFPSIFFSFGCLVTQNIEIARES
jgi:hypothetical protein